MPRISRCSSRSVELVGGSAGALGVIGVASRADEIGAGRIDAMLSAKDVAKRFTNEMDKTGICQAVVPVSGLLALTARTLRQSEFVALEKLAGVDAAELTKAMLSVDRFVREDSSLPVDAATRAALLDRFGMFGIRISIAVLRAGVSDSVALADELLERSGLVALRDVIDQQFAQRSDLLKAHTALLSLRRFVETNPIYATRYIIADIDPLLADTHAFEELRLLSQLRSRPTTLNEDEMASLRRIIGGSGTDAASRLGLQPDAPYDGPRAAFAAAQRWRRRADHPAQRPVHHPRLPGGGAQRRGAGRRVSPRAAAERRLAARLDSASEPRGVVGLVGPDHSGSAGLHHPPGDPAVGARQPARRQRLCDQRTHPLLVGGIGGEQHP